MVQFCLYNHLELCMTMAHSIKTQNNADVWQLMPLTLNFDLSSQIHSMCKNYLPGLALYTKS